MNGVREGSLKTLLLMDHKDSTEMQGGGFCDNLCIGKACIVMFQRLCEWQNRVRKNSSIKSQSVDVDKFILSWLLLDSGRAGIGDCKNRAS